jgi:hypothetical protein
VAPGKFGSKELKKSKERGISEPAHLQIKQETDKTEDIKSHGRRPRRVASGGMAPSLGESLKEELGINPPHLPTVSGGVTHMSDDYLQGLSIDSGGTPNFFHDKSLNDDAHTISLGAPANKGWGGNLGGMLVATRSTGSGRSGGSSGGKSPGYFNNNELSELFSIVRGKSSFGEPDGTKRRQSADAVKPRTILKATATTGAGLSQFEQLASLPEHLRALPPIRTKSMPGPGGGVHIQESSGRLFAGLTPHGYIGSGLTPTAVTPGSITGFPGVDHFGMSLTEGHQGGLTPGMPGWASAAQQAVQTAQDELVNADGGNITKQTFAGENRASNLVKVAASRNHGSKAGAKKGKDRPKNEQRDDDVDNIPLSGLVKISGVGGAAVAAAAAAAKLGISLPGTADKISIEEDIYDVDDDDGDKLGSTKSRSRSWLPSEDELVRALVAQHGPRKWTLIASRLKTKTQKQVYARWRDYLQPGLTTKPWSKEEQAKLVELQAHVGNQWAVLARLMPGRSPNAIKNRFHATKRKMERHNKREGSNIASTEVKHAGKKQKTVAKVTKSPPHKGRQLNDQEEEYSKEEQMAVEGLLLADTPTSLLALTEKESISKQFDVANASIEDRMREEADKAKLAESVVKKPTKR